MLAAVVVAVAFDDFRAAGFPLFEFVVVLADDVQPFLYAGAGWFHYLFPVQVSQFTLRQLKRVLLKYIKSFGAENGQKRSFF